MYPLANEWYVEPLTTKLPIYPGRLQCLFLVIYGRVIWENPKLLKSSQKTLACFLIENEWLLISTDNRLFQNSKHAVGAWNYGQNYKRCNQSIDKIFFLLNIKWIYNKLWLTISIDGIFFIIISWIDNVCDWIHITKLDHLKSPGFRIKDFNMCQTCEVVFISEDGFKELHVFG